jgi:formylglycine-generating enzyme required for sulfatase activity
MTRPLRVFLCHSSNDKPTVRELYQKLRAEKWIDPWLDEEELYPGQDWNMEIEKAVEAADAIIVCLSKTSITKEGYVQRELRTVLDFADYKPEGTLYIIPVRLEECEPPRRLRPWQYADYFEGQRERAFQRLLVSLKRRADALGLMVEEKVPESEIEKPEIPIVSAPVKEEIKEEPKKKFPAKPFTKLLDPSSLFSKEKFPVGRVSNRTKPVAPKKLTYIFGGIALLVLILGGFGLNYLVNKLPVATIVVSSSTPTATDMAMPETLISTRISFTPTPQSTKTPIPKPTLIVGETMIGIDGMTLLAVPAGEFTMGDSDTGIYQVDLSAFWIDQTEVTNAMYAKCMKTGKCDSPSNIEDFRNSSYANYPVAYVDWNMANAYCSWANRRLPTEAEWEKAARGTDGRTYPWGEGIDCGKANFSFVCTTYNTSPVKSYTSGISPYGAYDMAGNVWEWVSSLYKPYPYDANDGRENMSSSDGRVLRGGAFSGSTSGVRSAIRLWLGPSKTNGDFGFRCARSP